MYTGKLFKGIMYLGFFGGQMSGRYDDRYNERRPNLSFRISPEVKDQLLELQDGSDKTLGEIAENVMNDALMSSKRNRGSDMNPVYPNRSRDNVVNGDRSNNNLYDDGFKNGFKNGSNHAKKDIKNRLTKNSQKINDKVNGL
ncbi:unnamed protein product, partial [marine sediment metagenome]